LGVVGATGTEKSRPLERVIWQIETFVWEEYSMTPTSLSFLWEFV
jgi:hypothetical protein